MTGLRMSEGEHPPAVRMLSGCQEAVNKLSREKIFFAQTHFLESTNQNTNVNTKIPKNRNRRNFSSGCQEAVKKLSTRCRRAVGPALRENPSSTEVKSCQSAPQGVSIDPCQADTKKFRPALLAVQEVFTLCPGSLSLLRLAEHHPPPRLCRALRSRGVHSESEGQLLSDPA